MNVEPLIAKKLIALAFLTVLICLHLFVFDCILKYVHSALFYTNEILQVPGALLHKGHKSTIKEVQKNMYMTQII